MTRKKILSSLIASILGTRNSRCHSCNEENTNWGRLEWTESGARLVVGGHQLPNLPVSQGRCQHVKLCPQGHPIILDTNDSCRQYALVAPVAGGKSEIMRELEWVRIPDPVDRNQQIKWKATGAAFERNWVKADLPATSDTLTSRAFIQDAINVTNDDLNNFLARVNAPRPKQSKQHPNHFDQGATEIYSSWGGTIWPLVKRISRKISRIEEKSTTIHIYDLAGEKAARTIDNFPSIDAAVPSIVGTYLFILDGAVLTRESLSDLQLNASTRPVEGVSASHAREKAKVRSQELNKQIRTLFDDSRDTDPTIIVISKADAIRHALAVAGQKNLHGLEAWAVCFGADPDNPDDVAHVSARILAGASSALNYFRNLRQDDLLRTLQYQLPEPGLTVDKNSLQYLAEHILTHLSDPKNFWHLLIQEDHTGNLQDHAVYFPPEGSPLGHVPPLAITPFGDEFIDSISHGTAITPRDLLCACVVGAVLGIHDITLGNFDSRELKFTVHCAREVIDSDGNIRSTDSLSRSTEGSTLRLLQLLAGDSLVG